MNNQRWQPHWSQTKHKKQHNLKTKNKTKQQQQQQQQQQHYFIKSQTSDSFVNHFDGHFAYLKTLDFSFKLAINCVMN